MHDLQKDTAKKQKKHGKEFEEQTRKHRIEIELKEKMLLSLQQEFDKKSAHWIGVQDTVFALQQEKESLLAKMQALEQKHERCHQHLEAKYLQEINNLKLLLNQANQASALKDQTI